MLVTHRRAKGQGQSSVGSKDIEWKRTDGQTEVIALLPVPTRSVILDKKPSCCWHGRPYCPSRKTTQTKDRHTFRNWSGSRPGSWKTVPQSINCALLVPSGHWPVPKAGHVAMHALWSHVKFIARRQVNATFHMQSYGSRLLQFGMQAFSHK